VHLEICWIIVLIVSWSRLPTRHGSRALELSVIDHNQFLCQELRGEACSAYHLPHLLHRASRGLRKEALKHQYSCAPLARPFDLGMTSSSCLPSWFELDALRSTRSEDYAGSRPSCPGYQMYAAHLRQSSCCLESVASWWEQQLRSYTLYESVIYEGWINFRLKE
jgi:hypothetical protein